MLKVREEHARKQKFDYSHVFRRKSRFDLIRLSCMIMGIEFAYAAETAFVSPILLSIGLDHSIMTMFWALSPLLGFFISPLLGSISDRCKSPLGRRRPILLVSFLLKFYVRFDLISSISGLVNRSDIGANFSALREEHWATFGRHKYEFHCACIYCQQHIKSRATEIFLSISGSTNFRRTRRQLLLGDSFYCAWHDSSRF